MYIYINNLITLNWFFGFFTIFCNLGGESSGGRQTRNGVAVCSQKRAMLVAGIVLGSLLLTALIIAFAGSHSGKLFYFINRCQ